MRMKALENPETKRFARFLVNGGISLGVNLVSRFFLNMVMPFEAAVILAYLLGMAVAFVLFRLFVFEPSARSAKSQLTRFALVNLVAVIQVWAISVVLADYVFPRTGMSWHPHDVAHVIGALVPVFSSYLGHKHFSFSDAQ
jgi:putative flippase GtrA